jgi:iron complex outermembrane receptor protein
MPTHFKLILLAGAAWSATAGVAMAADPAPAPGKDTVEELVVTARRTEENQQRTPVSVSAFSQRTLDAQGAKDTTDLQGAVPNLNIAHGRGAGDATNIYIRGVGQPDALQTFDPAVGVYVDDVYYSRIQGTMFELLDLADVEVLRGPQGTLYGKNTIGGALKLTTVKPSQTFHASADLAFGNYNSVDMKGAISGPVTDTVAIGVAALDAQHSGYVKDPTTPSRDYNNQNTQALRAQIAWTPTTAFRLDLTADYTRENPHLTVGQATNTLVTAFGGTLQTIPSPPPAYNFQTSTSPSLPNKQPLTSMGIEAEAGWKFNDVLSMKSITAYRRLKIDLFEDIDATPLQLGDVQVAFNQAQFTQEFQLNYVQNGWNVVGGLYYLHETIPSHQEAYANDFLRPFTFLRTIDDNLNTSSWAAYINASYALTDKLRISGGLRYTNERKTYFRTTSTFSNLAAVVGTFAPPFTPTTWTNVSPMASIDYQVTPAAMLYARYAQGFQSGGFNGRANSANQNIPYNPEDLSSYEVGAKTEWFDHRLRLNGDVFYNDYTNFQASVGASEVINGVPTPILTVLNAGKLNIYGVELEASATPMHGLKLDSEIGYLDAKYARFDDTSFPGGTRKWETPAFSPRLTARFGGSYAWEMGANGSVTLGVEARYRSQMALSVDNADPTTRAQYPGMWQGAYWVEDLQLVWDSPDRRYSVGIYGKNIGDTVYKNDAQNFITVGHILTAYYGDPATWNVTFRYRY